MKCLATKGMSVYSPPRLGGHPGIGASGKIVRGLCPGCD